MVKTELFVVLETKTKCIIKVYGVAEDSNGYPKFLVRDDTQWRWRSAKHYIPVNAILPQSAFINKANCAYTS